MGDLEATLAGESVVLLPERALFWQREMTLFAADMHWGKAAAFRAASIAVPGELTDDDLRRLSASMDRMSARRIVFLGDLLHARTSRTPQTLSAVSAWRDNYRHIDMLLVRGNHDKGAGDPPAEWGFTVVDAPALFPPFAALHHPASVPGSYALAGHLHPAVQLTGRGAERLMLPCFWFGREVGVLPSFGSFTGSAVIAPAPSDAVYIVADGDVIRVN